MRSLATPIGSLGRTILVLTIVLLVPSRSSLAMDPVKRADIMQLVQLTDELTALRSALQSNLPQIMDSLRKKNGQIPDTVWETLRQEGEEVFRAALPDLEEPFIVMYDDNYTADEIKQLLDFFASPIGRKLVRQQPRLCEQGYAIGRVWGERVGRQISEHIRDSARKKGYEL